MPPDHQPPVFRIEGESVTFWVKVKPRSSRERLEVDSSGELRLAVHAAPTEGQANDACIRFLATALHLPRSSVTILTGHKSRRKLIRVSGPTKEIVERIKPRLI